MSLGKQLGLCYSEVKKRLNDGSSPWKGSVIISFTALPQQGAAPLTRSTWTHQSHAACTLRPPVDTRDFSLQETEAGWSSATRTTSGVFRDPLFFSPTVYLCWLFEYRSNKDEYLVQQINSLILWMNQRYENMSKVHSFWGTFVFSFVITEDTLHSLSSLSGWSEDRETITHNPFRKQAAS